MNPYDNASCESFIKTLKREEIYANEYQDLDHLRSNIEEFIERYLPSAIAFGLELSLAGRVRARCAARKRGYNNRCYSKILPAERGESFYVAGRGRDSDAVPSPDSIPAGDNEMGDEEKQCQKLWEVRLSHMKGSI